MRMAESHVLKRFFRDVCGTTGIVCKQEFLDSCLHTIPVVLEQNLP
jgi:hypothetical protein